jgi:hypothetical protein
MKRQTNGTHTCHSIVESSSTHGQCTANKPDIIVKNKKEKACTLIDMAIHADGNVVQKEAEKKLKYKCLGTEIQ